MFEKIKRFIVFVYRDKKLFTLVLLLFVTIMDYCICVEVLKDFGASTNTVLMYAIRILYVVLLVGEIDKIIKMKIQREIKQRVRKLSKEERRIVAIHEAGHAVVALFYSGLEIKKISIKKETEDCNGYIFIKGEEKSILSQKELQNEVIIILGGIAAEKFFFGQNFTGVENDLARATEIVVKMLVYYGMDSNSGLISMVAKNKNYVESENYKNAISKRTNEILLESERQAARILEKHSILVEQVAKELMEKETLEGEEVYKIFSAYKNTYM